jgi:hypothetical protein
MSPIYSVTITMREKTMQIRSEDEDGAGECLAVV